MLKNERYIDLHLHTKFSDGERSLDETIDDAKKAGLSAIAITDHNNLAIHSTIYTYSLEAIPGSEFSTTYKYGAGKKAEVHVVGLFFNGVDPSINSVFRQINKNAYVEAIIAKLNTLGIPVSMEELKERNQTSKQYGRMMIADLIIEKGFAADRNEAMDRWIGNFSPYYINSLDYINYIDTEEGVRHICEHGGLPILAHPFHYKMTRDEIEELVERFRSVTDQPLGIEVYYAKYSEEQVHYLEMLADKHHLLRSASSDRHRLDQPFMKGRYELLLEMKKAMGVNV